jgi:DNA-binding NarL/FixJ family response regulator
MKIAIIDDHAMILDGLRRIVSMNPLVTNVRTFANGNDFLSAYKEGLFDLVITDVDMPGLTGTEIVTKIRDTNSEQKILVLSMHKDHALINVLFNLKINGYLVKDGSSELLNEAIDAIFSTGNYISKEMDAIINPITKNDEFNLTKREIEIVQRISNGLSNKEIADKCFISETTVKTHRKNIMLKLNLKNTAELVRYAIEKKIA